MKENITFGEYIQECELFEYSKEYFDLVKEAGEITLMEIYLDSQDFMTENAESLPDEVKTTLLCESATYNESMVQAYEEKAGDFFGKIGNFFKSVGNALLSFLKRIANVFTGSQDKKIADLEASLSGLSIDKITRELEDKALVEELSKKIELLQATVDSKDQLIHTKEQEAIQKIALLTNERDAARTKLASLVKAIGAAFSTPELKAKASQMGALLRPNIPVQGPTVVFEIASFFEKTGNLINQYVHGMKTSKAGTSSMEAVTALKTEISNARKPIKQSVSKDKLDEMIKAMEPALKDLDGNSAALTVKVDNAKDVQLDVETTKKGTDLKDQTSNVARRNAKGDFGNTGAGGPSVSQDLLNLLTDLKKMSGVTMKELKELADQRGKAIAVAEAWVTIAKARGISAA